MKYEIIKSVWTNLKDCNLTRKISIKFFIAG